MPGPKQQQAAGLLQQSAGVIKERGVGPNRSNRDKVCGVRMLSRLGDTLKSLVDHGRIGTARRL